MVILGRGGFGEDAYRYYLNSLDSAGASYAFGGKVAWPLEARSQMIARTAHRAHVADEVAPGARNDSSSGRLPRARSGDLGETRDATRRF
jgi:hypothetical protein